MRVFFGDEEVNPPGCGVSSEHKGATRALPAGMRRPGAGTPIEDEGEECYGRGDSKAVRLCMAGGGSHAWDCVIMSGCVYIHRHPFKTMELEDGKMLICDGVAQGLYTHVS